MIRACFGGGGGGGGGGWSANGRNEFSFTCSFLLRVVGAGEEEEEEGYMVYLRDLKWFLGLRWV